MHFVTDDFLFMYGRGLAYFTRYSSTLFSALTCCQFPYKIPQVTLILSGRVFRVATPIFEIPVSFSYVATCGGPSLSCKNYLFQNKYWKYRWNTLVSGKKVKSGQQEININDHESQETKDEYKKAWQFSAKILDLIFFVVANIFIFAAFFSTIIYIIVKGYDSDLTEASC